MEWNRFNTYGDAERAFEALSACLFERWCRKEYGERLQQFSFVNGAGGDGGVEAYATLHGGVMVGLQAKWFREPLTTGRLSKVRQSLGTAVQVRPTLGRYVVALPRNLSDKKLDKRAKTTERDRWDRFVAEQKRICPGLEIELWDDSRLTLSIAELGSEGLTRYWFDRTVVRLEDLKLAFNRQKSGWLSRRYCPDLHQAGKIEKELAVRLEGPASVADWQTETQTIRALIDRASDEVGRLFCRFPDLLLRAGLRERQQAALANLSSARIEAEILESAIRPGSSFPTPPMKSQRAHLAAVRGLLEELRSHKTRGFGLSPTAATEMCLEQILEKWSARQVTPAALYWWSLFPMYVAEAGAGKTHAFARVVESQLEQGSPALLLRALDFVPREGWDSIFRKAVDEPSWSLRQILDALEAAVTQADVRKTSVLKPGEPLPRSRVLVAIDGLDESGRREDWAERLGELGAYAPRFPRILFAFSLRPHLAEQLEDVDSIASVPIGGSDPDLLRVFAAYCKASQVDAPPLWRWALRTPLAVRLFAELYDGHSAMAISLDDLSLVRLMRKKLDYVEQAIRELDSVGWSEALSPVRHSLRAITRECLRKGRALSTQEALGVAESRLVPVGILPPQKILWILEQCRDRGLLFVHSGLDDEWTWEPAYQVLTDYLLADQACDLALEDLKAPIMPNYLQQRPDAEIMAVSLLGAQGHRFYDSELWANSYQPDGREEVQLAAIPMLPSVRAIEYRGFVESAFTRNMPSCRRVVDLVVKPSLRVPAWPFGARFVHDLLLPLRVADRDLFWSGPFYLPYNHGGVWEGEGPAVLEELKVEDDDSWDAAPLLLAWVTTTVDNKNRRRVRAEIARWGRNHPEGLLCMLGLASRTNDPQMLEDILSASYGAACLTKPNDDWKALSEWIVDSIFSPGVPLRTNNIVVRHSARGLVARALACGVEIDVERIVALHSLESISERELLSLDREIASKDIPHHGIEPATFDLADVVHHAIEPFFRAMRREEMGGRTAERSLPTLGDVDETVLNLFVAGDLRRSAESSARAATERQVQVRALRLQEEIASGAEMEELIQQTLALMRATVPGSDAGNSTQEKTSTEATGGGAVPARLWAELWTEEPRLPDMAIDLLNRHATALGLETMTAHQFAFGFVSAFVRSLGWEYREFLGEPNGGAPGEILGPDIAVSRHHHPARHGSRSEVGTFAEKYVWLATHELIGYLADRLRASVGNELIDPPVDPCWFAEATNPAAEVAWEAPASVDRWPGLFPHQLTPSIELTHSSQVARANEWVEKAPLPEIEPMLFPDRSLLPLWAQTGEWLILKAVVHAEEPESQARALFEASCATFPQEFTELVVGDLQGKAFREYLHDFHSSIERAASYVDPHEATWAPWLRDSHGIRRHRTLDRQGEPILIDFRAATCSFHWDSGEGESEIMVPAESLRRALRFVDFRSGEYLDSQGHSLAFFHRSSGDPWKLPFSQVLLVRREAFDKVLQRMSLAPCWGVRIYREPAVPLLQEGWSRTQFDWTALALLLNGELRTFEIDRSTKTYTPKAHSPA